MIRILSALILIATTISTHAQEVIPLKDIGGLHSAYVVPRDTFNRVDVQLIVLSGSYDDDEVSGTAHFLEHLAAFSADTYVLREPRARDLFAKTSSVATIYTNSGAPNDIDRLMKLSRAVLNDPVLPKDFLESEIKIVERETLLRERQYPTRWLRRINLQNLYGSKRGRANNMIEDLPRLNLQTALEFHKKHYAPANVMVLISGKISPEQAAAKVKEYFGDTEQSTAPEKWWLNEKPDPNLRHKESLSSDRLQDNIIIYSKFIDLDWVDTSIDLQGEFFIGVSIFQSRIREALMFNRFDFQSVGTDFFMAKNGDTEMNTFIEPMPGVDFETALATFENTFNALLDKPVTAEEIDTARKRNAAHAKGAARGSQDFLRFLENVASDGLPPISPGTYAKLIEDTTDAEVLRFIEKLIEPSATSILFAAKED
ncbi:insulinase family protein [Amylibacter sp. IMCC11727]|uniref:M16 family metallopeptidase n=1 Tax=Amylibacter sp. IMCC11727 TaxID=3039851 RepID=UPI00244E2D9B|nr:insulinase family protein [Amylibacter sp. IMCC11727]WGI22899.1 insulinase family protein [Amylibacter sp. IMCC11727]